jgi:hypothetical protein
MLNTSIKVIATQYTADHGWSQIWEKKIIFIQTNSFIILNCLNPVLLVLGFGQVGLCKAVITVCYITNI